MLNKKDADGCFAFMITVPIFFFDADSIGDSRNNTSSQTFKYVMNSVILMPKLQFDTIEDYSESKPLYNYVFLCFCYAGNKNYIILSTN
jgi:hypothetical protein